jgi:hypothetical protein
VSCPAEEQQLRDSSGGQPGAPAPTPTPEMRLGSWQGQLLAGAVAGRDMRQGRPELLEGRSSLQLAGGRAARCHQACGAEQRRCIGHSPRLQNRHCHHHKHCLLTRADIKTREDVLKMGIDVYNEECRSIVMRWAAGGRRGQLQRRGGSREAAFSQPTIAAASATAAAAGCWRAQGTGARCSALEPPPPPPPTPPTYTPFLCPQVLQGVGEDGAPAGPLDRL